MITLVGTGHVFDLAARVREEVRARSPQVVAIELDEPRFHALRNKDHDRAKAPLVYRMLADFQTRIADQYGVEAGDEMLAAADEAQALGVRLALIDADAQRTFQRLMGEMPLSEKLRFLGSAVGSLLVPSKSIEAQVQQMQDDYASYFDEMGKKFPTIKRILLDDRNAHMARALSVMARTQERIVAVMGDGHVDGVRDLLAREGLDVETVRLKALRAPRPEPTGTATATVSWDVPAVEPPPKE